ncbi:hypothetical protein DL1_00025 [Thioclava dalianensis]|uniref:Uncharacterized protein n=1 Tax=Thioclava dalianensis TaxID=1185766 RepID=A0A074TNN3_9RHOB|nr:hypothetical protein [Thioclava dalianensis]KEP71745.1 hypothetical protein DL1_00025 [Thioclava dalianensis]SFN63134.1 hypothetical protein SAMN05216224_10870 [Thioclava dalianensis]
MPYQTIDDHTQIKPGDMLEYRCPRFGLVTQWKVAGIHLGALHVESMIEVQPLTNKPAVGNEKMMVPEKMTRGLTIIRAES